MVEIIHTYLRHTVSVVAVLMLLPSMLSAQPSRGRIAALADNEEYVQAVAGMQNYAKRREQSASKLSQLRAELIQSPDKKPTLSADILRTEGELYETNMLYNQYLQRVTSIEQTWLATHPSDAPTATDEPTSLQLQQPVSTAAQKAVLVHNDGFAQLLSVADYTQLRASHTAEQSAAAAAKAISALHEELLDLQEQYAAQTDEKGAEEIFNRTGEAMQRAEQQGVQLQQLWSKVLDSKIYAYDMLLEQSGNTAQLQRATARMEVARAKAEELRGRYFSDALTQYCLEKSVLLGYEREVATTASLSLATDSLTKAQAAFNPHLYEIAPVSVQRRYFIDYAPITVARTAFYTSHNPLPRTKIHAHGTVYRILMGTYSTRPNIAVFRNLTPLSYSDECYEGRYAYFAGGFATRAEADKAVEQLRAMNFRRPKVTVWVDGTYFDNPDEADIKIFNVEIQGITALSSALAEVIKTYAPDCTVSRAGAVFVVGPIESRQTADQIAAALRYTDSTIEVQVVAKPSQTNTNQ